MAILERKCRASRDTLVRERQDMVAMSMKAVMVILPTNMDTLLATQSTQNRICHRATPDSQASLLDRLVHRVSQGLQINRKEVQVDHGFLKADKVYHKGISIMKHDPCLLDPFWTKHLRPR